MLSIHFSPKNAACWFLEVENLLLLKLSIAIEKSQTKRMRKLWFLWKSVIVIWIRFLPHQDAHLAFQLTLQVLEALLFPSASCRILIPLKSNCKSSMNYDLVPKIGCPCAIHLTRITCLIYLVMIDRKPLFLLFVCFFFNSFQNLSNNMFLTISRWPITESVDEEEAEDKNQQKDSKCRESRLVIQFQG